MPTVEPPKPSTLPDQWPVTTERLLLRPVSADDLPPLMAVNGDPEVTRFLPYRIWQSLDEASAWLTRMQALEAGGTARQLVLARRDDHIVIGTLLLFRHEAAHGRLEVGYALARARWGQGLMHEALDGICRQLFTSQSVRRVEAEVNPRNAASCRLLERAGFVHEGTLRQRWVGPDGAYDTRLYARLRDDAAQAAAEPAHTGDDVTAAP